jgi:hypothetical protein
MTIRHGQYVQDVEVLQSMYQSLESLRRDGIPKGRQWHAAMAEGPLDQIRHTQAEMHEYLKLPYPLPAVPPPAEADAPPRVADAHDFRLALEQLCRLYRALGSVRAELAPYRPRLYAALVREMLPDLYAAEAALDTYLERSAVEKTLAEMAEQLAATGQTEPAAPSPASPELSQEKH